LIAKTSFGSLRFALSNFQFVVGIKTATGIATIRATINMRHMVAVPAVKLAAVNGVCCSYNPIPHAFPFLFFFQFTSWFPHGQ
jgi:hypothetical protein